jgi:Tol biopolymer transport system component
MAVRLDEPGRHVVGVPVQVLQDVHGVAQPLTGMGSNRSYMNPRLSPDGRRLAIQGKSPQGTDIWVIDLATRTPMQLTTTGSALSPTWSRDGAHIILTSTATGRTEVESQPADGSAPAEKLFGSEGVILGPTATPDGATLVFEWKVNGV